MRSRALRFDASNFDLPVAFWHWCWRLGHSGAVAGTRARKPGLTAAGPRPRPPTTERKGSRRIATMPSRTRAFNSDRAKQVSRDLERPTCEE